MESDNRFAAYRQRIAEDDWRFARAGMSVTNANRELWRGTFDSDGVEHEVASVGVLASVDLWKLTGNQVYADSAVQMADTTLASQERQRPDWDIPFLGRVFKMALSICASR